MIHRLQLFRNVGQFDTVAAANLPLSRLTLIYAENGRGKTTLAAILRSLGTGDPLPIAERRRLVAQHPPHIVVDCVGGPPAAMFQNNAWNRSLPDIVVFDDIFIDQNVYSGLSVDSDHRQRLHELILGAQGVNLNEALQGHVARIDEHNRALRAKGEAIPAAARGTLSVDDFCALAARADIDADIQRAERAFAAAEQEDAIRTAPVFDALTLPGFDEDGIAALLQSDLPALDAAAAEQVRVHLEGVGADGEAWVAEGMQRLPAGENGPQPCPFCAQDLRGSPLIAHYRAYFSEAYANLKQAVAGALADSERRHGGLGAAAFERSIRTCSERRQFWSRFSEVPEIALDTAEIGRAWRAASDAVAAALRAKQAAPLDRLELSAEARAAIEAFNAHRDEVAALSDRLQAANGQIALVKEQAAAGNRAALAADVAALRATKARHSADIAPLFTDYLDEKAAKAATEGLRDAAREALDQYRAAVFPAYQAAINIYLQRFNTGFRVAGVTSTNTRTGSSCTYNVVINNQAIQVGAANPAPGGPSFRNTLSAGDRNTLALAFFFASLDQDANLAQKIVIIDDPITSLDDHRSLTTVQEVRNLAQRTAQVVVLSHNKPFLCRLWEGADPAIRTALELARDGAGSTIRAWDVTHDCITEHDRRHALLRQYLEGAAANNRPVATAIRPVIEAFCRVAYPEHFPPGTLLGPFRNVCELRVGTPQEILDQADTQELREIVEYANRFHHDTNQAWETEHINDAELLGFVRRTLNFVKR